MIPLTSPHLPDFGAAVATNGFSGADLAGLLRSATSFALERYADEALMQGWAPGAGGRLATTDGGASDAVDGDTSSLLEVRYADLIRALREVRPTGDASSRVELARATRGEVGGARRRRLRGWWREARLRRQTERVLEVGTRIVAVD